MTTYKSVTAVPDSIPHGEAEVVAPSQDEKVYVASAWTLMWWRFRRHKVALISTVIVLLLYLVALFCEFVAPYDPGSMFSKYKFHPPTSIHVVDAEGNWHMPFVYQTVRELDRETLRNTYNKDTSIRYPVRFFVRGEEYKLWGLFPMNRKLFGVDVPHEEQGVFLMGTDRLGRDMFSRVIYGARISLSVGLAGVLVSLVLGIFLGGVSGYYGGAVDNIIQRVIEFLRSIPSIPLWMGLSAALPTGWSVLQIYFGITLILSFIGWTGMARVVRGRFLQLREEDFITAAKLSGASEMRLIVRHMLPSFLSHIIAALTLSIPGMIMAETSLSFLGLGLREPVISWGVLLQESQNVGAVAVSPWIMVAPAAMVVISVLAFNFMGDGLRDAADPYAH
ncbi:MAG: ABC transporter permease [Caldilineaceae bacterium]|nr:ABC transporter permease [Caldilineaceae bacterium]